MTPVRHVHAPLRLLLAVLACMVCGPSLADNAPVVATAAPTVAIGGEVATPLRLDAAVLSKLPRQRLEASAHGVSGTWEGVTLVEVLRAAGVPVGDKLRGANLMLYVRIGATDGYQVVYALAELDPGFRDARVILADTRDGKPLDAKEGPFRLVAADEKRPGRWVRNVQTIDVLRAPK